MARRSTAGQADYKGPRGTTGPSACDCDGVAACRGAKGCEPNQGVALFDSIIVTAEMRRNDALVERSGNTFSAGDQR